MPSRRSVLSASAAYFAGILPRIKSIFETKENSSQPLVEFTWMSPYGLPRTVEFGYSDIPLANEINRNPVNVVVDSQNDPAAKEFAKELERIDKSYTTDVSTETIRAVRQNINFVEDFESTIFPEFPRYPSETTKIKAGDCTDMVILASGALTNLDIDHYVILYETHAAVLIREVFANGDDGLRYEIDGNTYAYTELTSNRPIGNTPDEFMNEPPLCIIDPFEKKVVRANITQLPTSFMKGALEYFRHIF